MTVTLPVDYGILPKLQGKIGRNEGHMCQVTVILPVDYGILPKLQGEIGQYEGHMCHVSCHIRLTIDVRPSCLIDKHGRHGRLSIPMLINELLLLFSTKAGNLHGTLKVTRG